MTSTDQINAEAEAFAAAARKALDTGEAQAVSDDKLAEVLTAAIKLYAARVEFTQDFPAPLTPDATATDVIVTIAEMMRFADLNMFDLNMWLNRPRPENN